MNHDRPDVVGLILVLTLLSITDRAAASKMSDNKAKVWMIELQQFPSTLRVELNFAKLMILASTLR
jgi:hypothetical protein